MTLGFGIFTFVIAWCISLLPVMPFAITYSEAREAQNYIAAPQSIRWKKAFMITSIVALIETLALAWIIQSGLVSIR